MSATCSWQVAYQHSPTTGAVVFLNSSLSIIVIQLVFCFGFSQQHFWHNFRATSHIPTETKTLPRYVVSTFKF